ncbi:MAG: CBS domain-containing protein [Betaproteobacteria bacterium]|nr:MAG: CBS domain-containing protein [Betaproteobacteria bacterium]
MKPAPAAQPYLDALIAHDPFAEMAVADVGALLSHATVTYHAVGETLIDAQADVDQCWIVLQGRVRGERPTDVTVGALELTAGEMFPIGALLTARKVVSRFFCETEVFALRIPSADFLRVAKQSAVFSDFCNRKLTFLLERSRRALQASYAAEGGREQQLPRTLQSLIRREAVSTLGNVKIRDALSLMQKNAIGSLVIVNAGNEPIGIITERDIVPRVVLADRSPDDAVETIATTPVATLPAHASSVEAALLMAERGFRHVVVVDERGALAGIVSERDLFALQRHTLTGVSGAINRANSVTQLAICASDARQLARNLIAQGVESLTMTRFVSRLNDQLVRRVIELIAPTHDVNAGELCWIALGSEGRHEQTISTDQDNALILSPGLSQLRALDFAKDVNAALDQCGFPLCKGNIMASNPALALTVDDWIARFAEWTERGDPESLLQANIFFDLRPLWGDAALANQLQAQVLETASANQRFLKQLSDNAQSVEPPLNWLGNLSATAEVNARQVIDLKRFGVRPFVDAARVLALAHQVPATNTIERLQAVAALHKLQPAELSEWTDAFSFLQSLRLRAQERSEFPDYPNAVAIDALSPMDARILKECFRQARKLQQRVAADYP